MEEIDYVLSGLGYSAAFFFDDKSETLTFDQLSQFSTIIYHNGGWPKTGSASVMQALSDAADAGKGLIFLGDDAAYHAQRMMGEHGSNVLFDLMGIASYDGNGSSGLVTPVANSHPVINGSMGTVGSFFYIADIDEVSPLSTATTLMEKGGTPAVVSINDGISRRVLIDMRLNNSTDCPSGVTAVPLEMKALFQNAFLWVEWKE